MKQASNKKKASSPEQIDISELTDIEIPYQDDWFFETRGPQKQRLVYLRFQATGWATRRIGPYSCKGDALADLDCILSKLMGTIDESVINGGENIVRFPFQGNFSSPVHLEDPYFFTSVADAFYWPSPKGA